MNLPLQIANTPRSYLTRYTCEEEDCGTVSTDGGYGPSELFGELGLTRNRRDFRYCPKHESAHWTRWWGMRQKLGARRERIRLYLAGKLPFGQAPLPGQIPIEFPRRFA